MLVSQRSPAAGDFSDLPGIKRLYVLSEDGCRPPDPGIEKIAAEYRGLGAEALLIDVPGGHIIVAGDRFDDVLVAAECDHGIDARTTVRMVQMRLADKWAGLSGTWSRDRSKAILPAEMVRSTLTRWEWKISLVFGRRFASRLIAGATCDKRQDSMTWDNLMAVKRTISEKTGYFIDFTEST